MATQPPAPGSGWRPDVTGPSRPSSAPSSPASDPAWRQIDQPKPPVPTRIKLGQLAGVLGLVLGTSTALVWVALWLAPPGPAVLVLAYAGYEENLTIPANPQGREAVTQLGRMAGSGGSLSWVFKRSGRLRLTQPAMQFDRGADWAKNLDQAKEKTVIVFLAMHGAADQQGAYLLPNDAKTDIEDRLRIQTVLDRLAKLPPEKHKLLILDATALQADWSLGVFHNNFARALEDLEPKIAAIPNLVVISSSAPDQISRPAAHYRLSLFGHHLITGLTGVADRDRNGRLDAWELFTHVREKVEEEAAHLRGVRQTPVILPHAEGEERARAISMTFQLDSPTDDVPVTDPLPDIQQAWQNYQAFLPRDSAAVACLPKDWELWQAWLLRYEQLRLAGSPQATAVLDQAQQAERRVLDGLQLGMVSAGATLSMPTITGQTQLEVPNPYAPAEQLWQAAPGDRRTLFERLRKAEGPLLRRNLLIAFIRRAAENPTSNLARAADLARFLDDPLQAARPAEAHYLVMLARDLPSPMILDDLRGPLSLSLKTRLLAEETALAVSGNGYNYAERLRPRIAPIIDTADQQREKGQDLLFSTSAQQWKQAEKHLQAAHDLYDQARALTKPWREAIALCDRARAELPLFSNWVAGLSEDPKDRDLLLAIDLFGKVRQLEELVNTPGLLDPAKLDQVTTLTKNVQSGMSALRDRLESYRRTCESNDASSVHRAEVMLTFPWLSAEQRSPLLRKLGRLEQRARSTRVENADLPSTSEEEERARRQGIRQGRLALAALGTSRFDQLAPNRDPFAEVLPHIRRPSFNGGWPLALAWAGEQLAYRRTQISQRIQQLLTTAKKDPAKADAPLDEGDQLVRLLDAGQCQMLKNDPVPIARRYRLGSLLVWQAERTWRDHWYNDDPKGRPYYSTLGSEFLRDAKSLDTLSPTGPTNFATVQHLLNAPDGLRIVSNLKRGNLIAGENLLLSAAIDPAKGTTIDGYPVYWSDLGEKLALARLTEMGRSVVTIKDGKPAENLSVTVTSPELEKAEQMPPVDARPERTQLGWNVYYRGQKPQTTIPISLYPVPESTRNEYRPPPQAALTVRADQAILAREGDSLGGITLVFDCSGSVGAGENRPATASARFRESVAALRKILEKIPRGVKVSLWTFGQAVPPGNSVDAAEDTIRSLESPATWEGGSTQIDAFINRIEALTPWNESPITRAILRAREDLKGDEGGKMVIVLTDGDDNRFAKDRVGNPKSESIADAVRKQFAGSNISLHLVGFEGKGGKPEESLTKNYGMVKEMNPAGSLSTIENLTPLLQAISRTFKLSIRYRLTDSAESYRSDLVEVSRPGENDRWLRVDAQRDPYRMEIARLSLDRRLTLADGDAVILGLGPTNSTVRRLLWSREPAFARRPAVTHDDWRSAIIQNQLVGERALQMLLSVEKIPQADDSPSQVHPGEVWMDVKPTLDAGQESRPAIRWGAIPGYPAPTWGVDAPGWPVAGDGPARPKVQLYWTGTAADGSLLLQKGTDFVSPWGLHGKHRVGSDDVDLLPLSVEEHWVQVAADRREKRWCLVVRLRHAVNKPAWVRLSVHDLAGQEHRHFLEAGRYVGLFWFPTGTGEKEVRDRFQRSISTIRLYAADALKERADFPTLDTPASTPPRPTAVLP